MVVDADPQPPPLGELVTLCGLSAGRPSSSKRCRRFLFQRIGFCSLRRCSIYLVAARGCGDAVAQTADEPLSRAFCRSSFRYAVQPPASKRLRKCSALIVIVRIGWSSSAGIVITRLRSSIIDFKTL